MTEPFCFLASYHYLRTKKVSGDDDGLAAFRRRAFGDDAVTSLSDSLLFLDSGAFSARTQGAEITVTEYGRFAARVQDECHLVANLDVIGHDADSAEASWRNYRTLHDDFGVRAMPVVHVGEPFEVLDRYLDAGETYIAIGGLVMTPWKAAAPWTVAAFQRVKGHAALHGFGVSSLRSQLNLPWYTVDHSSWNMAVVVGSLSVFVGRGRHEKFSVSRAAPETYSRRFNQVARSYNVDPTGCRYVTDAASRARLLSLSARSVRRQEHWMRRRHGVIEHPTGFAPPGLRTFFASTYFPDFGTARAALLDTDRLIEA